MARLLFLSLPHGQAGGLLVPRPFRQIPHQLAPVNVWGAVQIYQVQAPPATRSGVCSCHRPMCGELRRPFQASSTPRVSVEILWPDRYPVDGGKRSPVWPVSARMDLPPHVPRSLPRSGTDRDRGLFQHTGRFTGTGKPVASEGSCPVGVGSGLRASNSRTRFRPLAYQT